MGYRNSWHRKEVDEASQARCALLAVALMMIGYCRPELAGLLCAPWHILFQAGIAAVKSTKMWRLYAATNTLTQPGIFHSTRQSPASCIPQVSWTKPMPAAPRVAIIGGGLSGLACAQQLAKQGIASVVFDTGAHGPGGRLATRGAKDGSLKKWLPEELKITNVAFDHAAQARLG